MSLSFEPPVVDEAEKTPIVLEAQTIAKYEPESASKELGVPDQATLAKNQQTSSVVSKEITALVPDSPDYMQALEQVRKLGQREVEKVGERSSVILNRRSSSVAGSKKQGNSAQESVATSLAELRSTVDGLSPTEELSFKDKFLRFIGGNKLNSYFQRYVSSQAQLDGIIKALMRGKEMLDKDTEDLKLEMAAQYKTLNSLNETHDLLRQLSHEVRGRLQEIELTDPDKANKVKGTILKEIEQRDLDVTTQIAVGLQGYMSMRLIINNNQELSRGVDRARNTTVTALRTAVIVSQALADQKLVLDQIDAVNATTNNLIEETSRLLGEQTAQIHEQAVNSGVSVQVLEQSFERIYQTMDAIDEFNVKAADNMADTIGHMETLINKSKKRLEGANEQPLQLEG